MAQLIELVNDSRRGFMTIDQNKKTLRHFQSRDYLWEIFEQMSAELECSTDYLINEAMRQYARSRNYGTTGEMPAVSAAPSPSTQEPSRAPVTGRTTMPTGGRGPSLPPPPPPRSRSSTGSMQMQMPTVPAPPPTRAASRAAQPPTPQAPPPSRPRAPTPQVAMTRPTLFVIFNGQKIPVNKDEFVIGRGTKSADLAIKDGNISRRHAAVIFQNGSYYMKDLGSTNGVEFQGQRVDAKRIEEGDQFRMCDYEFWFTYQ
jgi:hypothetical protein